MITLLLDVDGVLNGHEKNECGYGGVRDDCARRFNRLVREAKVTHVTLVSAWRYMVHCEAMTLKGFQSMMLTHGVDLMMVKMDLTRMDVNSMEPRGLQIMDWLGDRRHSDDDKFLILDDLSDDHFLVTDAVGIPRIRTEPTDGLTDANVLEALIKLNVSGVTDTELK